MSGVIDVISRQIGEDDISFGVNSFIYVDINGVPRRVDQVNASSIPWYSFPALKVDALVDGSQDLPVGASQLAVVNTSVFSGPIYGSGTTSGYVKNYASGLLVFGESIATADIPSGIPASSIGSGTVDDTELGYLDGVTSGLQSQINAINSSLSGLAGISYFQPPAVARLVWTDANTATVTGTVDNPALVIMNGFPNVLNPGFWVTGGLTNAKYYQVTAATTFVIPTNLWGTEQANQWYAVLATTASAAAELSPYVLQGMPYLRARTEGSQVIHCGTNTDASVALGYTFTVNAFVGGMIYVLSGAKAGEVRTITANDASATDSTISYSGTALNLVQGDWFVVLPPGFNFRRLGDAYNDVSSNMTLDDVFMGMSLLMTTPRQCVVPFINNQPIVSIIGGGGAGTGAGYGDHGRFALREPLTTAPGTVYSVAIGAAGAYAGGNGGSSYVGALIGAAGGVGGAGNNISNDVVAGIFFGYGVGGGSGSGGISGQVRIDYDAVNRT